MINSWAGFAPGEADVRQQETRIIKGRLCEIAERSN